MDTTKPEKKSKTADTVIVKMIAFTGMNIGEFKAIKTKEGYEVTTKSKKTLHFNASGAQTDAKNPKFGNKLIFA